MLRILAAFVLLVAFAAEMRAAGEVGSQAPDFEFLSTWNIPGGQTRLSSFRGSVVLVESFATWWQYCAGAVPHLNQFQQQYASRGFTVLSVSDEDDSKISSYSAQHGSAYPVVRALGVGRKFGSNGVPHAWLISTVGSILWEGHPNALTADKIEAALGGAVSPSVTQGQSAEPDGGTWWIWLIVGPGILFAGAMGWFLWSTRDRTAKYQTQYYPAQQYAPQGQAPPQGQQYPQPQSHPQAQAYPQPQSYPQAQPYPQQQPQAYGQPAYSPYGAPQPFPQQPGQPPSYPMQEPYQQQTGYNAPLPQPDTRVVRRPNNSGAHGAYESPGAASKAEPPPLEQRPYLGQKPGEFPPFDANRNPPRQY